jgi:hypothetical protein
MLRDTSLIKTGSIARVKAELQEKGLGIHPELAARL